MDMSNTNINKESNQVLWDSLYNDFNEITDTHKRHFNYIENSLYEFCKGVSSKDKLSYSLKNRTNEPYLDNNIDLEEKKFVNEFLIQKEISKKDISCNNNSDNNNELLMHKSLNVEKDKNYNIKIDDETDYLKKYYLKNNYLENEEYVKKEYLEDNYLKNNTYRNVSFNNALNNKDQIKNSDNFNQSSFLLNSISKKADYNFDYVEKNKCSFIKNPNEINLNTYNSTYFNNEHKNNKTNLKAHKEFFNKIDHNFLLDNIDNKNYDNLNFIENNRNFLGVNTFNNSASSAINNLNMDKYKNFKTKSEENLSYHNYNYINNIKNFNSLEKLDILLKNKCKYMNGNDTDVTFSKNINGDILKEPFLNSDNYKIDSVISENYNNNNNNNKKIDKGDTPSDKMEEINHNILINRSKRLIEISKKCLSGYSDLDNMNIIDLYKKENNYSNIGNYRDYKNYSPYHPYLNDQVRKLDINENNKEHDYNCENEDNDEYEYTYENEENESQDDNKNENNDYKRVVSVDDKKESYNEIEIMKYVDNKKNELNEEYNKKDSKFYVTYSKNSVTEEGSISNNTSSNYIGEKEHKKIKNQLEDGFNKNWELKGTDNNISSDEVPIKKKNENGKNHILNNSNDYNLNLLFDASYNLKNSNDIINEDKKLMNSKGTETKKGKEINDEGNNNPLNKNTKHNKETEREIKTENEKRRNTMLQNESSEKIRFEDICEKNINLLDYTLKNDILSEDGSINLSRSNIRKDTNKSKLKIEDIHKDCNIKNNDTERMCVKEKKNGNTKLRKIILPSIDKKCDENIKKEVDIDEIKIINEENKTLDQGTENINYSYNIKRLFKEKYFLEDLCEKRKCMIQKSKIENAKLNVEIKSLLSFNNNLSYALKEKEAEIKILKKQKEELEMKLMKRVNNDYSFLDNSSTCDIYRNKNINSNCEICNKNSNSLNNMNDIDASIIENYEKKIQELLVKVRMYETKNNDLQEQLKIFMNE